MTGRGVVETRAAWDVENSKRCGWLDGNRGALALRVAAIHHAHSSRVDGAEDASTCGVLRALGLDA